MGKLDPKKELSASELKNELLKRVSGYKKPPSKQALIGRLSRYATASAVEEALRDLLREDAVRLTDGVFWMRGLHYSISERKKKAPKLDPRQEELFR